MCLPTFLRAALVRIRRTASRPFTATSLSTPLAALILTATSIALGGPLSAEIANHGVSQIYVPPQPMMRSAATIFSGTVLKVEHLSPAGFPGITQITFHVESAFRGARRGQNLTVHEWEGLWNSGERYHAGEHVLLFLYPKSKLGLTSPVGGPLGRYEIDRAGRVFINTSAPKPKPIHIQEFAAAIRRAVGE